MPRGRPRLSDAAVAALPKAKRDRTLKRRAERARTKTRKAAAGSNVVPVDFSPAPFIPSPPPPPSVPSAHVAPPQPGEVIYGLDPDDHRARALYVDLRSRLQAVGRWSGEATHGTLLTYVKTSLEIERYRAVALPPSVFSANKGAASALRRAALPADKVRKGAGRFGEDW